MLPGRGVGSAGSLSAPVDDQGQASRTVCAMSGQIRLGQILSLGSSR